MQAIRTYHLEDPISFRMKRMEEIHQQAEGVVDPPHRHDYYTLIFTEEATGTHTVDFHTYSLANKQIYFISPGQVHQLAASSEPKGWVLTFSQEFLIRNGIRETFISDINLFKDYGQAPPLELAVLHFDHLRILFQQMATMYQQHSPFRYEAIGAWLKLVLIECNQACDLPEGGHVQTMEAASGILRQFKALVNTYFREWHKVAEYAGQLGVTPDHLNKSVKSLTAKTAKEYIQSRITVEAKRQLLFSQLSAKELAYELGFETPSHFSSFFKKCTGQSPTAFRVGAS